MDRFISVVASARGIHTMDRRTWGGVLDGARSWTRTA